MTDDLKPARQFSDWLAEHRQGALDDRHDVYVGTPLGAMTYYIGGPVPAGLRLPDRRAVTIERSTVTAPAAGSPAALVERLVFSTCVLVEHLEQLGDLVRGIREETDKIARLRAALAAAMSDQGEDQ